MMSAAPTSNIRQRTARAAWEAYQDPAFREDVATADKTALRNLLAAAAEAEILEELYILFEYQVGRGYLSPVLRGRLRTAIDAEIGRLPSDRRTDEQARLEVARTWLQHVVRLHRAIDAERQEQRRQRPNARPGRDRR